MKKIKINKKKDFPENYTGIIEFQSNHPHGKGGLYYLINGKLHREDGPAFEGSNGDKEWWLNGVLHREDGPAKEFLSGKKEWYQNGVLHRKDGPAIEYGGKFHGGWYLNGVLHREDGPAIERQNGSTEWYQNGVAHREDGPAIDRVEATKWWAKKGKFIFKLPFDRKFIFIEEFKDKRTIKLKVLTEQGLEIWPNLPGLKELADNWEATK